MTYTVIGKGAADESLSYEKETLPEAYYLASKMSDNGVAHVHIIDDGGVDIPLEEAWEAFRREPLPGWTVR